jgi:rRNA-processing protein FCF1
MASYRVRRDKIYKTVILDSSAILMFFEFSVNWEKELDSLVGAHRLVVPTAVIQELQILATRNRGQKKATAALKLIEKYETIDADAVSADDALLKIAEKTQGVVVTNDAELRKRLKNRGFSVIFLRGKKKLVLDE